MQTATLDEFFGEICSDTTERVPFTIPTPGGDRVVWVEEIDALSLEKCRKDINKAGADDDGWDRFATARVIAECVTDGNGKRFFKPEHVERLARGRARYIDQLGKLCMLVNGLDKSAEDLLKKNCAATTASASPSISAVTSAA